MARSASQPVTSRAPVIGITMGDPSGIGPEAVVKALADPSILSLGRFVVYGLNELLAYAADQAEIEPFWYRVQHDSNRTKRAIRENVVVFDFDEFDGMMRDRREPTAQGGFASKTFVETALSDALRKNGEARRLDAIVTAPVCKQSWAMAGFNWTGHTELLQKRTNSKRVGMVFISPRLKVALATTHLPLNDIRNVLTIGKVFDAIDLGDDICRDLGIANPIIGVCGLNPHAGEGGLLGDEERRLIEPAIEVARHDGIDARGPYPADTIFNAALEGRFDLVVAMYHDQGLIPVKLLDRDDAVNVTVGLPVIRTSPDHGTAFDIAGRNLANAGSMKAAIRLAAQLVRHQIATDVQASIRSEPAA